MIFNWDAHLEQYPDARLVCWFSCGAASAVAAHAAIQHAPAQVQTTIAYCDTSKDEHPDNMRFLRDVETWLSHPVTLLTSDKYADLDDVFTNTRYMAGIAGARCTTELKKIPRRHFQRDSDVHVFGFTSDEAHRVDRFVANNPELHVWWPLVEQDIDKQDCFTVLKGADIPLPALYELGYKNNNCIGCVKATSARYWNMVRRDFPSVFAERARQSRELGVKLTRVKGKRVLLDDLPADYLPAEPLEDISCGPDCGDGKT